MASYGFALCRYFTPGDRGRRGLPETAKSFEQRMNDINTMVTALQGFKRQPVETTHEWREGHLAQTLSLT